MFLFWSFDVCPGFQSQGVSHHLHVMVSSDSPVNVTSTNLLGGQLGRLISFPIQVFQTEVGAGTRFRTWPLAQSPDS